MFDGAVLFNRYQSVIEWQWQSPFHYFSPLFTENHKMDPIVRQFCPLTLPIDNEERIQKLFHRLQDEENSEAYIDNMITDFIKTFNPVK
jgi:hypothetical protein